MLWSERVEMALGTPAWSSDEAALLLDLAREVAHGTERRFAPLTAYAIGVEVAARLGSPQPEPGERLRVLTELAVSIRAAVSAAAEDAGA